LVHRFALSFASRASHQFAASHSGPFVPHTHFAAFSALPSSFEHSSDGMHFFWFVSTY
jgi:hypothetical protein